MNADEEILAGYADPDAGYPDADTQTNCNNYQNSIFFSICIFLYHRFLKKYLSEICFQVFNSELWGYTYSKCCSKKKTVLRTKFLAY